MHYETSLRYEGPPCEMCQRTMFVGTCTHRPRRMPEFPPIKLSEKEEEEFRKTIEEILRKEKKG